MVGLGVKVVNAIRDHFNDGSLGHPCTVSLYQNMLYSCDSVNFGYYWDNVLNINLDQYEEDVSRADKVIKIYR